MNEVDILEQQAIDAAVNLQWKNAVILNAKILKMDSKNLSGCLRLGFAYLQLKKIKEAKKYYQKALRVQPKNQVALENLEKLKILGLRGSRKVNSENTNLNPSLFLEVPGKTKSITLVNIGQKKDIAELAVGQEVLLKLKKRKVEARSKASKYIGSLPDDISKRLIFFLKAKSKYSSYIKEAGFNRVIIFIQELVKGKKVDHYSSFPQNIHADMEKVGKEASSNEEDEQGDEEWDTITQEISPGEKEELNIHPEEEEETEE